MLCIIESHTLLFVSLRIKRNVLLTSIHKPINQINQCYTFRINNEKKSSMCVYHKLNSSLVYFMIKKRELIQGAALNQIY
jgi:hypothetical protein